MIYWLKDSVFADQLKRRLYERSVNETFVCFFLYLNLCTGCGVVVAWLGLNLDIVIAYILFSYAALVVFLMTYLILANRISGKVQFPHFSIVGDLTLIALIAFNEFSEFSIEISHLCVVIIGGLVVTVLVARSAFIQFVVSKTIIFVLLLILLLTSNHSSSDSLIFIFLLVASYLTILMNAYWLYLSQIRNLHHTLNVESLGERLKVEQKLSERLFIFIGHDLRQPLNGIDMLLYSMNSNSSTIARVREGVQSAKQLIDNILQIATYRAGEIKANKSFVSLRQIFQSIRSEFSSQAEAASSELRIVDSSLSLYADEDLLSRAIKNLISNAISYAPNAKVLIGVRRKKNGTAIWVVDQGNGISPEIQNQLLDGKLEQSESRDSNGFGLGLLIAREFIKANNGNLKIYNTSKKGTTIEIFFPHEIENINP